MLEIILEGSLVEKQHGGGGEGQAPFVGSLFWVRVGT
jgi:hypothetical protein